MNGGSERPPAPALRRADDGDCAWAPLRDPRWLVALGTLLVNDFVLKAAAREASWLAPLTGKLSDVAGLIVAPVLCWTLAGCLTARPWLLRSAFACPVAVFVLINVDVRAADAWVRAWSLLGVPQRIWSDAADLWALPALLVAHRLVVRPRPWATPAIGKAGAFLASAACVATSGPTEHFPGLRNASPFGEAFSIEYYRPALGCDAVADGPAALRRDRFSGPVVFHLDPGVTAPLHSREVPILDLDSGTVVAPQHEIDPRRTCGAAVVTGERLRTVLVTWDLRSVEQAASDDSEHIAPGTVEVEFFGTESRAAPGEGMFVFPWPEDLR